MTRPTDRAARAALLLAGALFAGCVSTTLDVPAASPGNPAAPTAAMSGVARALSPDFDPQSTPAPPMGSSDAPAGHEGMHHAAPRVDELPPGDPMPHGMDHGDPAGSSSGRDAGTP